MKTKKILINPDFEKSLSTLRGFDTFDLLYQEINARLNVNIEVEYKKNLSIWIPICYRIGLVEYALRIAHYSLSFFDKSSIDYLYTFYEKINAEELLSTTSEQIRSELSLLGITTNKVNYRKKSLFSIIKKGKDLGDSYDLLGIELYLGYDDFFSEEINKVIVYLKNNYEVIKMTDFLVTGKFYKYIPFVDLILRDRNGNIVQLKIKCSCFEASELGVNYFEYKEYNIDFLLLDDYQRISKILYLKTLCGDLVPEYMARFLFEEIKFEKYFHKNIPEVFQTLSQQYLKDIERHNQAINGVIL